MSNSYSAPHLSINRFSIGDVKTPFSLQAISKPITYAVTMSELGEEVVHKYQGREPSGRKINEIVLDYNSKKEMRRFGF